MENFCLTEEYGIVLGIERLLWHDSMSDYNCTIAELWEEQT